MNDACGVPLASFYDHSTGNQPARKAMKIEIEYCGM
jgi:hypothetical protein